MEKDYDDGNWVTTGVSVVVGALTVLAILVAFPLFLLLGAIVIAVARA